MDWYYAQDGEQRGPVSDADLAALVANNIVTDQTLVWKTGMAGWQAYGEVKEGAAPPPAAGTGTGQVICTQCGRPFALDQVVRFGSVWVCAQCKPVYVQQMREGVAPTGRLGSRTLPVDPDQLVQEVLQRGVKVEVGSCISRAWEIVKANLWLSIGTTLLVMFCMQVTGIVPFIGACIGLILNGPLMGGLYGFYLKLIRGETAEVGDGFSGFKRFGPLAGVFILMVILIYLPLIPCGIYAVATKQFDQSLPDVITIVLGAVGILGAMYLGLAFMYAVPLVADLEISPWKALQVSRRVVTRRFFGFFALGFACGCIMILGLLALCVGIFVAMPVAYTAFMVAYEDNFGENPSGTGIY